jgi:hypothetical protein
MRQISLFKAERTIPSFEDLEISVGHLIELKSGDPFRFCKVMGVANEHIKEAAKRAKDGFDFYVNPDLWGMFLIREEWIGQADLEVQDRRRVYESFQILAAGAPVPGTPLLWAFDEGCGQRRGLQRVHRPGFMQHCQENSYQI